MGLFECSDASVTGTPWNNELFVQAMPYHNRPPPRETELDHSFLHISPFLPSPYPALGGRGGTSRPRSRAVIYACVYVCQNANDLAFCARGGATGVEILFAPVQNASTHFTPLHLCGTR